MEELEVDEPGIAKAGGAGSSPEADASLADEAGPFALPEVPALPAVEERRQGERLIWTRWKGSLNDVAKVFRLTQELVEQASAGEPEEPYSSGGSYTVSLRGRERNFRNLEDLEAELPEFELDSIQGLSLHVWTSKVSVMIYLDRVNGAYLSVTGSDAFAVTGVEAELKTAMNKGRRWSQVGEWPMVVAFWAPWVAILGLSLVALSGDDLVDTVGKATMVLGGCLFAVVLFMRYVEPRLVPPLELLDDAESQTVAQVWKGRMLKALGFAAVGVAGAAINGLTGFLF